MAVLASGPSLTLADAAAVGSWRAQGGPRRAIVVNTTFRLCPWADALYASDRAWWEAHAEEVNGFQGEKWTQRNVRHGESWLGAQTVVVVRGEGLSGIPGVIVSGGNSGYTAIGLAREWGARRIVLLGFDMKAEGDKVHWHGAHPKGLRQLPQFSGWVPRFAALARALELEGVEVLNCSRETALECFARAELGDVLRRAERN